MIRLLGLLLLFIYPALTSCNYRPVHGHYMMADKEFTVFMFDFWGSDEVFIYAVRNDTLFLGDGRWTQTGRNEMKLKISGIKGKPAQRLDNANDYLQQLTHKKFSTFTPIEWKDNLKQTGDSTLKSTRTGKTYRSMPKSYYDNFLLGID